MSEIVRGLQIAQRHEAARSNRRQRCPSMRFGVGALGSVRLAAFSTDRQWLDSVVGCPLRKSAKPRSVGMSGPVPGRPPPLNMCSRQPRWRYPTLIDSICSKGRTCPRFPTVKRDEGNPHSESLALIDLRHSSRCLTVQHARVSLRDHRGHRARSGRSLAAS